MLSASNSLYMININVGELCFIPMNVHNGLFNGVSQLRWQNLSPVVSTFSTSIRLLYSFFIKHCILPPSFCPSVHLTLSVIPHPVFLISGLSLRLEMLMFSSCNPKFFAVTTDLKLRSVAVTHIHYPMNPSSDNFDTDAVVPPSDHCRTEAVPPPSDHYDIDTVSPSGDHYCIDIVVPPSDQCCTETVPPSSDHYGTTKVAPPTDHLHTKRT